MRVDKRFVEAVVKAVRMSNNAYMTLHDIHMNVDFTSECDWENSQIIMFSTNIALDRGLLALEVKDRNSAPMSRYRITDDGLRFLININS